MGKATGGTQTGHVSIRPGAEFFFVPGWRIRRLPSGCGIKWYSSSAGIAGARGGIGAGEREVVRESPRRINLPREEAVSPDLRADAGIGEAGNGNRIRVS